LPIIMYVVMVTSSSIVDPIDPGKGDYRLIHESDYGYIRHSQISLKSEIVISNKSPDFS
jgi:hypothetical protein